MQILDHGYCNLIETWGSDERVIESARMSTGKGFLGWGPVPCPVCGSKGEIPDPDETCALLCPKCIGKGAVPGDEKLLKFLWTRDHHSVFEMAGAVFEIQAPIFVTRQIFRHRSLSVNELSARYTEMPDLFYLPDPTRLRTGGQGIGNKQSSGTPMNEKMVADFRSVCETMSLNAFENYRWLMELGFSRELARIVLPVNAYTRFRASANLRMWLHFLGLRIGDGVQWETQEYAEAVKALLTVKFPRTLDLI